MAFDDEQKKDEFLLDQTQTEDLGQLLDILFKIRLPEVLQTADSHTAKGRNLLADTAPLEQEIDHLLYALFGLTPIEIKIVEGSE